MSCPSTLHHQVRNVLLHWRYMFEGLMSKFGLRRGGPGRALGGCPVCNISAGFVKQVILPQSELELELLHRVGRSLAKNMDVESCVDSVSLLYRAVQAHMRPGDWTMLQSDCGSFCGVYNMS